MFCSSLGCYQKLFQNLVLGTPEDVGVFPISSEVSLIQILASITSGDVEYDPSKLVTPYSRVNSTNSWKILSEKCLFKHLLLTVLKNASVGFLSTQTAALTEGRPDFTGLNSQDIELKCDSTFQNYAVAENYDFIF